MPGVGQGDLDAALERLLSLPKGHQFRAVADRSYRPRVCPNEEQWELAFPLFVEILAADPRRLTDDERLLSTRRATLARHLYWLARDYPDQMTPDFALDEAQVLRSAACSGARTTYRSRLAYISQVRSFRGGYPGLFPPKRDVELPKAVEPVTDDDFAIALQAAQTFRNPKTQDRVSAMLLLTRGAGADGADCRYVTGLDVFRRERAGLWVRLSSPGRSREVPVLARFAQPLEDLALKAGSGLLISGRPSLARYGTSSLLSEMLRRRLAAQHPQLIITPSRLRRAWYVEQLMTWEQLHVFLRAAGLKSMRAVEDAEVFCPAPTDDPIRLAEFLGGVSLQSTSSSNPSRERA